MWLCGIQHALDAPVWPMFSIASLIYLVPAVMPWRRIAIGFCVVSAVFADLLIFSVFVAPKADICDPPYFQAQMQDITLATAWAVLVGAWAVLRPMSGIVPILGGYLVAIIPAVLLAVF